MVKLCVLKSDSEQSGVRMKGHAKCKRHRLHFWCQHSVRCPSVFTTIKRSKCCSDILYTSGAHIPPLGRGNVIETEMIAGLSLGEGRGSFYPEWSFHEIQRDMTFH